MSKRGSYSGLRFCPQCGVEALVFDRYREAKNCPFPEYICTICGFGFRIGPSKRVEFANALHREHRKQRANVKFLESSVGSNIAQEFLKKLQEDL